MGESKLPRVSCPKCRKASDWYDNPYRPFCSERCRILDLGDWASEAYRFPGASAAYDEKNGETGKTGKTEEGE